MNIKTLPLGLLQANCYIITDEQTGETAVIDPGEFSPSLKKAIDEIGTDKIKYILLTHCHFDHTLGSDNLREYTGAKVVIAKEDALLVTDSYKNGAQSFFGFNGENMKTVNVDITVSDGDTVEIGNTKLHIMSAPGHTPGGVCYYTDDVIFTGDTMFFCGCGRCDLYGGDYKAIKQSLRKIADIKGDRKVYTGHGCETSLSYEREHNPELIG